MNCNHCQNYYVDETGQTYPDIPLNTTAEEAYVRTNLKLKNEVQRMESMIHETDNTIETEIARVDNTVQEIVEVTEQELQASSEILNHRIDTIIAHNNDTEGNTELIDIRTGTDGTVYTSAGSAVRTQLTKNSDAIDTTNQFIESFYHIEEYTGTNLFDPSAASRDKTLNYSGVLTDAPGYTLSDYIAVDQAETLFFSHNSQSSTPTYIFTFNSRKEFVQRITGSSNEYTVGSNIAYIRFNTTNERVSKYMVADTDNIPYEPYIYTRTTDLEADNLTDMEQRISNLETNESTVSKLFGKKLCVCGDSLTFGAYADEDENHIRKTYAYYTAKRNHMELTVNAVSGSTLTSFKEGETGGGAAFTYGGNYARYKQLGNDLDYITIWFGLNDNTYLEKTNGIGTIDSTDVTTFYGAWNVVLQYLIQQYPTAKIGIIVTYGASAEIRNATRNICKKYGIPPLDFMGDDKIPLVSGYGRDNGTEIDPAVLAQKRSTFIYSGDSVHMIDEGYQYFSTIFENYLNSL